MEDAVRFRLLGKYRTPRVRVGAVVPCEVRGDIQVVGFTGGPIPWPLGKTTRRLAIVVYGALAVAIRRESAQAVAHWWGVDAQTVWAWRKALGVGATTEGTSKLRGAYAAEPWAAEARAKAQAKAADAGRRAKIAAARRGKPRPRHVIEAMAEARRGTHHSEETRRRMSAAHKERGTWPPAAGRPWTPEEDELVRTLSPKEAARRADRSVASVKRGGRRAGEVTPHQGCSDVPEPAGCGPPLRRLRWAETGIRQVRESALW